MVAPACGSDDFAWVSGPDEGPWLLVMIGDALEDAALEPALGQDGEEALDGVERQRNDDAL